MASVVYPFKKSDQFKNYIAQFMRVFTGFQYDAGNNTVKQIPVRYGGMDRIAATVLSNRDFLTNGTLPMFAANLIGIQKDEENKRSQFHVDNIPNLTKPVAERTVTNRIIGPALIMNMGLSIYASSLTELMQIVEQIMLLFNPRITIAVDTMALNGDYLTDITLEDMQPEIQMPMGTESRVVMMELTFSMPIRLKYPTTDTDNIIKEIRARVIDETSEFVIDEVTIDEDGEV